MTLREVTESVRARGEKALVPFLTAGFPDERTFLRLLAAASEAGCPVIEVGIPFSDPIADGPVIQESSRRALERGMTLRRALSLVERASKSTSAAIVLMGYVNPILRMGFDRFARAARDSGVSGVIIPDVPLEESGEIRAVLNEERVTFVDLVAPTTNGERIRRMAEIADGFLYLVSLTGVTGARSALSKGLGEFAHRVREHADLPLYVGFGVSKPDQAAGVVRHADGVIIGSALIRIIQETGDAHGAVESVGEFLERVNAAMNEPGRGDA